MNLSYILWLGIFIFLIFSMSYRWRRIKGCQKLDFNRPKLRRQEYIEGFLKKRCKRNVTGKHIDVVYDELFKTRKCQKTLSN